MAKVQQKSEKISAFGGIFFVLDRFVVMGTGIWVWVLVFMAIFLRYS